MKRNSLLWLMMGLVLVILNISLIALAQDDRRFERREELRDRWQDWLGSDRRDVRDLEGRWYVNGNRDQPAEIVSSRGRLEARNERGQTSRLEIDRDGDIRALDWERGLRGDIRRDRIEWENGTTWTRVASGRSAARRR